MGSSWDQSLRLRQAVIAAAKFYPDTPAAKVVRLMHRSLLRRVRFAAACQERLW